MRVFILFFCFFAIISLPTLAQNYSLSGQVAGKDNTPIEGAIVSLLQAKDSSFIKTFITETDGKFEFLGLKEGSFLVMITQLGYQNFTSSPITLQADQPTFSLPAVMQEASSALGEVTLSARKPFVERKIDRTIINPDALISNAGSNVLEVLEKAPGLQVDGDGNISLKGKQGVLVFIDDKPTYLSAKDLPNYLRSLPAGSVENIEIMPNPPAKYDAAGNAGVINVRLKKNTAKGFNGGISLSYGQGRYARTNNSLDFNYRINKINFFSNLSGNFNGSYQDLTIKRAYFSPTGELNSTFVQNSYIRRERSGISLKLGADYYINDKATLGVMVSAFRNPTITDVTNRAEIGDANRQIQSLNNALTPSTEIWKNGTANVNYSYKVDKKGKEITANLDYLRYDTDQTQSLVNSTLTPSNVLLGESRLDSELPSIITIQTAKVDYTNPLPAGAKWEAGSKASFIQTDNIANFFDVVGNVNTPNYEFSNRFKYEENIYAGYLNYSKEGKRFSLQAGLRFESTNIKGNQLGNEKLRDSTFTRNYNSFFPTLYLSYLLDTARVHQLGFSYGRRINRPNYQDMNPFTYPLDKFTLYGGNPFLKPTFSHNFELSHTFKDMITTTLQFSQVQDVITETIEQGNNIFYSRPGNLGKQTSYGISITGGFQITKWWTMQLYTEVTYNDFESELYGQKLRNKGAYWFISPTQQFKINEKWSAELGGNYQSSVYTGQFITIPVGSVRAGVGKKILKGKGNLKLNINDMFYTNQPGGDIKGLGNSSASWYSLLDTRVVNIAFSYRFNKGKTLKAREMNGSESEKQRVK